MSKTKTHQDDPGDLLMRDGRRLSELSPAELLKEYVEHTDPDSPNYNPDGATAPAGRAIGFPKWNDGLRRDDAVRAGQTAGQVSLATLNVEKQEQAKVWRDWVKDYLDHREREGDRDFAALDVEPDMVAKIKKDWTTEREQQFPVADSTLARYLYKQNSGTMTLRIESRPHQTRRRA